MREITMRQALNEAMCEEMNSDSRVFLIGEEVAEYNGAYKVSQGMLDAFGPQRVVDTPISENGFTGLAIGAAMTGLRPIVEFMSFNFSLVAFDQLISNAAKTRYMSGGQFDMPLVFRGPGGAAAQVAAQHSNCLEYCFANQPGLIVVSPSDAHDAKGLLKSSIRSNDPVIFIENEMLYGLKQPVAEGEFLEPIGKAKIKHEGDDVTIISYSRMFNMLMESLDQFRAEGINPELIDLRTIKPLDIETIAQSIRKTHRAVIVEEGHYFSGVGAQIATDIYSACFDDLDAEVIRVTQNENPLPYSKVLEAVCLPTPEKVIKAAKAVMYRS